jgi:hypothetical protein
VSVALLDISCSRDLRYHFHRQTRVKLISLNPVREGYTNGTTSALFEAKFQRHCHRRRRIRRFVHLLAGFDFLGYMLKYLLNVPSCNKINVADPTCTFKDGPQISGFHPTLRLRQQINYSCPQELFSLMVTSCSCMTGRGSRGRDRSPQEQQIGSSNP